MKYLLIALIGGVMAVPAVAQTDLISHYRPATDACVQVAEGSQGLEACHPLLSTACMEQEPGGQTTQGMAMCIQAEWRLWDEYLNAEYAETMDLMRSLDASDRETLPEYAVRADQLRAAQRAWIAFRDADCAMRHAFWGSGSMRAITGTSCMSERTFQRVQDLIHFREYLP